MAIPNSAQCVPSRLRIGAEERNRLGLHLDCVDADAGPGICDDVAWQGREGGDVKKGSVDPQEPSDREKHRQVAGSAPQAPAARSPDYHRDGTKGEILVPASVRIAREKAAARLQFIREKAAAKARVKAEREQRAIASAATRIAKALDRKVALREREAGKLDRKAQRLAFQLARKDKVEEERLMRRARREASRKQRSAPPKKAKTAAGTAASAKSKRAKAKAPPKTKKKGG